ncbi:MAG: AAA family ATPase [Thioalkalivibrionaceae bacterium]
MDPATLRTSIQNILIALDATLLGKPEVVRLALAGLLAGGHLLIEDVPGVGKTTLAHGLAQALGLAFNRVQFTNDLLPSDILGVSIFDRESSRFEFHAGPIFAQVLLADEINRATAKTQSALLEAMEEHQVTVDGQTRSLPEPFFVIATQNPLEQIGTHPLPESQLDRFLFSFEIGYPDARAERDLLSRAIGRQSAAPATAEPAARTNPSQAPQIPAIDFPSLKAAVDTVYVDDAIVHHIQHLLDASRRREHFRQGLSPRAGLGLLRAARSHAFLNSRDYVGASDVEAVLGAVVRHRLHAAEGRSTPAMLVSRLLELVPTP